MKTTAIILHLYYMDLWEEFENKIKPILSRGDVDLYVTLTEDDFSVKDKVEKITPFVFVVPNKGLDVGPFLYVINQIKDKHYSSIFKIHSKKSPNHGEPVEFGENWRNSLVDSLIKNEEIFEKITKVIERDQVSMIGCNSHIFDAFRDAGNIPWHYSIIKETIEDLGIKITEKKTNNSVCFSKSGRFIAGTMFATSHQYIKKLFSNVDIQKLYEEMPEGYVYNSKAHALERIFGFYLEEIGGNFYGVK